MVKVKDGQSGNGPTTQEKKRGREEEEQRPSGQQGKRCTVCRDVVLPGTGTTFESLTGPQKRVLVGHDYREENEDYQDGIVCRRCIAKIEHSPGRRGTAKCQGVSFYFLLSEVNVVVVVVVVCVCVKSKETIGNSWTVLKVILGHNYHHSH